MMVRAATALAALTLAAAFAPVAAFGAAPATVSYDMQTKLTDVIGAGEYDGRLRMQISADGILNGSFMDTEGHISDVIGGLDGTKVWIDLGHASPGQHYFNGTLINGKLEAGATRGLHTWTLEGTERAH